MSAPSTPSTSPSDKLAADFADNFADALVDATRRLGHPLCVGLDPHLDLVPPIFRAGTMAPGDPRTAEAVESFLAEVIDRVANRVAVVKPQIAFFEALGPSGLAALTRLVSRARERGLLVLLDAKRGDIGSTARAYAAAYLAEDAPLEVDAITLNPYLGGDSLTPFVETAENAGRGLFVLVKTSNPGGADFQDRQLAATPAKPAGALSKAKPLPTTETLWETVARSLHESMETLKGSSGWSSLGVVAGATWPGMAERLRELLPRALFLVPGYGAQGGSARDAVRGFVDGPAGREGGVVNSSRGVVFPAEGRTDDAGTWERALENALERAIEELRDAVA